MLTILSALFLFVHSVARPAPQSAQDAEIRQLVGQKITACDDFARLSIRAAFHDGNSGRLAIEIDRLENLGLQPAFQFYNNECALSKGVALADCISLGGAIAVQKCGGPQIDWKPGRKDNVEFNLQSSLPDPKVNAGAIKRIFQQRQMSIPETVALIGGGHSVAQVKNSPEIGSGPTDSTPGAFDVKFFQELKSNPASALPGTVRIPADTNMMNDPEMGKWVDVFAANQSAFMAHFKSAFEKMISIPTGLKSFQEIADEKVRDTAGTPGGGVPPGNQPPNQPGAQSRGQPPRAQSGVQPPGQPGPQTRVQPGAQPEGQPPGQPRQLRGQPGQPGTQPEAPPANHGGQDRQRDLPGGRPNDGSRDQKFSGLSVPAAI